MIDLTKYKVTDKILVACPMCNEIKLRQVRKIKRSLKIYKRFPLCPKCSSKSTAQIALAKRIETFKEKYGVSNPQQIQEFKEKRKKTFEEKYKTNLSAELNKTKEKIFNNYGTLFTLQSNEIREKIKQTDLEKYSAEYFFKSEHFKNIKENNLWFFSKAENEIKDWIESMGIKTQKKYIDNNQIDIFIPSINLGIECNGLYWHSELYKSQKYHLNKTLLAQKHNIKLIQIFEHEWKNRKNQVKSRLKSLLGLNKIIYARKLTLNKVEWTKAKEFIDNVHIQPLKAKPLISFGLYDKDEIFCIATFSLHHRNNKEIVLSRFCCKDGFTIIGGLSKITKYASNYFKKQIVSWCDLRWSDGNGYEKSGWKKILINKPDYFYTDGINVIAKQARMKSKVKTPDNMTEHEHALKDGLLKVWDCGKIKYVYDFIG